MVGKGRKKRLFNGTFYLEGGTPPYLGRVLEAMTKKCRFRKKNGNECGADTQSGKNVCVFHDPTRAAQGRRARRKGGINRSQPATVLPPETLDRPLDDSKDVATLLADSINRVRCGQLDVRIANTVGYLSTVLLRALEGGPLEERLSRLEIALGLAANTGDAFLADASRASRA
jgi:hypothetical protein